MPLEAGTRLGPYEILALIGTGGMGEVYLGQDVRLDRRVAIKVQARERTDDRTTRERFDREARAVAALAHPHICALFDIGREGDVDYLVMEYVEGETLASRLDRGRLPLEQALAIALQAADALASAHRAGIVHRDLKPSNIMMTSGGPKLLDFGIAKHRRLPSSIEDRTATDPPSLTKTGMILGTVQYMAPEQLEGQQTDERADIFSFGVVLYELFTQQQAFSGRSTAAIIGRILHTDPPRPSSFDPRIPPALDALIRKCLEKDPNARCQSVAEVQRRLSAIVIPVRPRKRIRGWFAAALLTCAGVIALARSLWSVRDEADSGGPRTVADTRLPGRQSLDQDIYALQVGGAARALLASAFLDEHPQYSPDGQRIAFTSARAGQRPEIWVAASDGSGARQLTHGPGRQQSEPHWSPDGRSIAFESLMDNGDWHIWTVPASGGVPHRLTSQHGDNIVPSWSRDGRWIYFSATDGGRNIWRVAATGGEPQRLTISGSGSMGCESTDGTMILYKKEEANGPLFAAPIAGGHSRQIVPCVRGGRGFAAGAQGIYYVACDPEANPPIRLRDPRTGRDRVFAVPVDSEPSDRDFAVSPDGATILYSRLVAPTGKPQ